MRHSDITFENVVKLFNLRQFLWQPEVESHSVFILLIPMQAQKSPRP